MRLREILREAGRDLASGTARAVLLAVGVAAVAVTCTVADLRAMGAVVDAVVTFRSVGASIRIVEVPQGIDARVCDGLTHLPGVRAAGALRKVKEPLTLGVLPSNPLTLYEASPAFATMLPASTGQSRTGLLVPTGLARTLGVGIGQQVPTSQGTALVGGTYSYPEDGRPPGMGWAAIALVPADHGFDECWMDAHPVAASTAAALLWAISADLPVPDADVVTRQHNSTLGLPTVPARDFLARPTARLPLVAFAVALVLAGAATWMRRLELASALHVGVRRLDQMACLAMQTLVWAGVGAAPAVPVALALTRGRAAETAQVLALHACMNPLMGVAGALVGTLVAAALVRERRIFTWFKSR
ncbi:hypothetical protein I6B53_02355 [Schaalia sp. 19OD2882]|uniref:hypothetical protein n=1 Tax=Schaalia sp. 19OD2882 TaxID=2794089 RepID=UPI001C1EA31B|nr:hypothetical protein [Schaalia sp. 19OD2882]QWW19975.1 hypothetical protein I6B53_02355 [Schaalia sp. 19OD2882]